MSRVRLIISLLAAFTLLPLALTSSASAHVLKSDDGISAVLHIPPDDNPLAGQSSMLSFSFNSDNGNFMLDDCGCEVNVMQDGKQIQTTSLQRPIGGGSEEAAANVTFPSVGVYDVLVTGTSKTGKFSNFKLDYIERVAGTAQTMSGNDSNSLTVIAIGAASFVLLGMGAYTAISNGKRYKQKKQ